VIRACLASIPGRTESLRGTVDSLLGQVDRVSVYLNGYEDVPAFLENERIDVARSQDHGDRGDAGKMFWTGAGDFDYYISCDDDLVYPPDFAERMVAAVDEYHRSALVGCHGVLLKADPTDYYRSRAKLYHNGGEVVGAHSVHVVATSSLCWHRSIPVRPQLFKHPNMADMWISAWANERGIPRIVIPHEAGWLQFTKHDGDTIWDASRRRDGGALDTSELQGKIARETAWVASPLPEGPRQRAVVSIITHDREDALLRLLGDVERERKAFNGDVEVRVYHDDSPGYEAVRKLCAERGYAYWRTPEHYGREQHWRLVTRELSDLRERPADWYVFLPDDVRLCGDFFARTIAVWETLEEPVALNIVFHSGGAVRWTKTKPRKVGDGVEIGWIDGMYICRRELLELVDYRVPVPSEEWIEDWVKRPRSSGVGKLMSETLVAKGAKLYRPKRSLAIHQGVPSTMHGEQRERQPLTHLYPVLPFVPGEDRDAEPFRLSVAMMAHRKRSAQVKAILGRLDRECTVVWDEKGDRWDTGRRAMLAYDPKATHHAVIQDDVLVCRDLFAGLERALAKVPAGSPLCGYIGKVRPGAEMVRACIEKAEASQASWVTMHTLNWGPLVVVPTACIPEMIAYCDKLRNIPNYDRRLSRYFELQAGIRTWYPWPSLVDHADGPSVVTGRMGTDRANGNRARIAWNFLGEEASALELDWGGPVIDADQALDRPERARRAPVHTDRRHAAPAHADSAPVVYHNRVTGENLQLKPWSPRVRRLRGLPSWELVKEGAQA